MLQYFLFPFLFLIHLFYPLHSIPALHPDGDHRSPQRSAEATKGEVALLNAASAKKYDPGLFEEEVDVRDSRSEDRRPKCSVVTIFATTFTSTLAGFTIWALAGWLHSHG